MNQVIIPENYHSVLSMYETQDAIGIIKEMMQKKLCMALRLKRVTAPLFVDPASGLNDDLNGVERPVSFEIPAAGVEAQVVHSLAKWKRMALYRYDFRVGKGILTDMNAIRRDEELDNLHSLYVDQWDWEKTITREDRNVEYLKKTVKSIYKVIKECESLIYAEFPHITPTLPDEITFIHTEELLQEYPRLSPKERETAVARRYGAVFLIGIGQQLSNGTRHDGRAPDYDDWTTPNSDGYLGLNGDIIFWDTVLETPVELSSMGIRVDKEALLRQLDICGCPERAQLSFHRALLNDELPLSIGGGIGQSRFSMFLLQKAHIGEVQASIWPEEQIAECARHNIHLL